MMTRIVVTIGTSLTKLSLVQRMSLNTMRRPIVKLISRNAAVPIRLWRSTSDPSLRGPDYPGGIFRYGSAKEAIFWNAGAATTPP